MVLTAPLFVQCRGGRYGYDWAFEFSNSHVNPFGVHKINPSTQALYTQALKWCEETFGPGMDQNGEAQWGFSFDCLLFEDPRLAMMFKLQWC
jgi:hypothetical protein